VALRDTYLQTDNIPEDVKRVVVATGSGLTAAGVLAGLAKRKRPPVVLAVAISGLANQGEIIGHAQKLLGPIEQLPKFALIRSPLKYDDHLVRQLPDGTPLDPYCCAKAYDLLQPGDCLWTPGLRPVSSMPEECQRAFRNWNGF
jgi:hypothetical protein